MKPNPTTEEETMEAMNNQAGRSDEQRAERCMVKSNDLAWSYWHCSLQKGHEGNHRAYESHDITAQMLEEWPNTDERADAASRLPKAEAATEIVPDDCLDITDDGRVHIAVPANRKPVAPPVEEGEDDPVCQLPSCGHPLSMHDDGEGGCTAPSDFSEKDYGGDVGVQPSPCICSRFRPVSAEGEDPRNGFAVEIALCRGGEAVKTLGTPEEVRFIIGEALDRHGIEEEIDYTLTVSRAQIPISSAKASSPTVAGGESDLVFIGYLRRDLLMPYDCKWNGYVRDITAELESEGMLVSRKAVNERIYKDAAQNMSALELIKGVRGKE